MNKLPFEILKKFVIFRMPNAVIFNDYNIHDELPGFHNYQELTLRLFNNVYSEANINQVLSKPPFVFKCYKTKANENGMHLSEKEYFYAIECEDGIHITSAFDKRLFILTSMDDLIKMLTELEFEYLDENSVVRLGCKVFSAGRIL